jgi:hypothetical protein
MIDYVIESKDIAGALVWSLRHHREEGGFYWHSEPMGLGIYKAYHWPGFASGDLYDETNYITMFRNKSFEIRQTPVPAMDKPLPPKLLPINTVYDINWQGSVGASYYNIERSQSADGPWECIANNIDDASVQYTSLFHDKTAVIGNTYYYRIIAGNIAGISSPSDIAGPVVVETQAQIDEMSNYGVFYSYKNIMFDKGSDRKYKEDMVRAKGSANSELIYLVPGKMLKIEVYSFEKSDKSALILQSSLNGIDFKSLEIQVNRYFEGKNDYNALYPVLYEYSAATDEIKFVKVLFTREAQISRIKIIYK